MNEGIPVEEISVDVHDDPPPEWDTSSEAADRATVLEHGGIADVGDLTDRELEIGDT